MPRIEHLYAFVALDSGPDDEGFPAAFDEGSRSWLPLVASDLSRLQQVSALAQRVAEITKVPLRLVEFTVRRELTDFVAADQFETVEQAITRIQQETLLVGRGPAREALASAELDHEARASVALDRGEVGTHYVGDGCPGGHR
ncbi:MAG: hypothetical protein AB7U23_10060 [Dehalococcoidia bacterium]